MNAKLSTKNKDTKKPKVSIICTTYNHADFIRQALDSFIMQETNFTYEVLINDDASTDGTSEIIKEYQKKYPHIIKPNIQNENLYSQGIRNMMIRFLLPNAKGKYIALCEGDDYWTDATKLQRQVDFLDKHSDYALCFHPVKVFFENNEQEEHIFPAEKPKLTVKELLKQNYIQTNSVMYRRQKYTDLPKEMVPGDWFLHLYHAYHGKIGYINKAMSAYRRHQGGMWWNAYNDIDLIWKQHGIAHLALYIELLHLFDKNNEYREVIHSHIIRMFNLLMQCDQKYSTSLVERAIQKFPYAAQIVIQNQQYNLNIKDQELNKLNHTINELNEKNDKMNKVLTDIDNSLSWKITKPLRASKSAIIKK